MTEKPHTVNGKFSGIWYELDDGRKLYLAHRTPSQVLTKKMAWTLSESLLRSCADKGVQTVGVVMKRQSDKAFFLTLLEDFYDTEKSFSHFHEAPHRGLPLKWFRLNPGNCAKTISKISTLTR